VLWLHDEIVLFLGPFKAENEALQAWDEHLERDNPAAIVPLYLLDERAGPGTVHVILGEHGISALGIFPNERLAARFDQRGRNVRVRADHAGWEALKAMADEEPLLGTAFAATFPGAPTDGLSNSPSVGTGPRLRIKHAH
jgi:hypothetical protein